MRDNNYLTDISGLDKAIIIQARMSSNRFPAKMMQPLAGLPLVEYVYTRCKLSPGKTVIIATSDDISDDILYDYCKKNGISIMRGNLCNVLERYIQAAELVHARYIVRVCGDTPFVDISLIDRLINMLMNEELDYVSLKRETCASGFYSEVVHINALKEAANATNKKEDIEHVTKFILDNPTRFSLKLIDANLNPEFMKNVRLTIDFPEDIEMANNILAELPEKLSFTSQDVLNVISQQLEIR